MRIRKTILRYKIKQVIISGEFSIWIIPFIKIHREIKKLFQLFMEQN